MIYWIKKYFTNGPVHAHAVYEVLMTSLFSLSPFIITYFVGSAKRMDGSFVSLSEIVGRGQLYLLAYGIFGTVFWLAFLKSDRPRHGARAFLGGIATLLIIPVIGFFGVDPTFSTVLNPSVVHMGYYFYFGLLFLNYLIIFYLSIDPPEPGDIFSRETSEMAQKYKELSNG